jgi:hypothetical protein
MDLGTNMIDMPEEIIERIGEAHWSKDEARYGVHFTDIVEHDVINHTLAGTVDWNGVSHGFVVDNGNWNGFVVRKFGLADDVEIYNLERPEPCQLTFIPKDRFLKQKNPAMYKLYLYWREQSWFKDKVSAYHYDRHFQPGGQVEKHYREWAEKKGMEIGVFDET